MPHKPVLREDATSTKVRMVFDASAKLYPSANSINNYMYKVLPLQTIKWVILATPQMAKNLLIANIQKAVFRQE